MGRIMLKLCKPCLAILPGVLSGIALAQSVDATDASDLDRVVVTGIRGSLQSSLNLKRDSLGVVDGIIAEDIGKFPDTNLAESLQRISGVSIDRNRSGEGSKITVRGVGPDYNLVLFNGRQMPAVSFLASNSGMSGSRAFDFSNLASEAISELQIHKTVRADKPTGGMGALINVRTARPLNNPGLTASIGIKGVMDKSVDNIPENYSGKSVTPEVSAIFSNTWANGRFGIFASGSYQERDSGYSNARTGEWYMLQGDDGTTSIRLPLPGEPAYAAYAISNRPGPDSVYGRPSYIMYWVNGAQRQRRNGQVTLQFAPRDNINATLDYVYADNRVQRQRDGLQNIFSFGPGASAWTDGPVAAPIFYSEYVPGNNGMINFSSSRDSSRSELESVGLNLEWKVNDNLDLAFDWHSSDADIRPDNALGSNYFLGASTFVRGDSSVDFSHKLPVLNVRMAPGISQLQPEHAVLGLSGFRSSYQRSEVKQFQASGTFRFSDYQALDFGAASTDVFNRSADSANNNFEITGVGTAADYADDLWRADHMGGYFSRFPGHADPDFSGRFLVVSDFERLRARGIDFRGEGVYSAAPDYTGDIRTREKSTSAWLQWRNTFDWALPMSVAVGMRHEKTEVNSQSQVLPPVGDIAWLAENGHGISMSATPVFDGGRGQYDYWLPSLDVRVDLRDNLVLRGSAGKSIGRPDWRDIQGGLSVRAQYDMRGGAGQRGNPGLLPLESKNFDLSLEWYYGEGSYAALGFFRKNIKNFVGNSIAEETPFNVHSPINGVYWNEAINLGGCGITAYVCIRDYIFLNHAGDPGVDHTGQNAAGQQTGTIWGTANDPLAVFAITTPVNQRSDMLDGFEISVQHMFGGSGFGVAANYTKVDSGLRMDNHYLGDQYAMIGLSDSANLVVFYDKHGWQVRAAYNWRDEFLSSIGYPDGGAVDNPYYTESYGQLDVNVTWTVNTRLSVFVEGINMTDQAQRVYVRHPNMLGELSQTGTRYMFGARYRF